MCVSFMVICELACNLHFGVCVCDFWTCVRDFWTCVHECMQRARL